MSPRPSFTAAELAEREALILEHARGMLLERGVEASTMEQLARRCGFAKGTIYSHFGSKEEICARLAIRTHESLRGFFERAASFRGMPRERMCAIGCAYGLFFRLQPKDFALCMAIKIDEIGPKLPEKLVKALEQADAATFSIVSGIVRDAIASGHIDDAEALHVQELTFGLWGLTFGSYSLIGNYDFFDARLGDVNPFATVDRNCHRFMDGSGWRPLFGEHDWEAVRARVADEVFPTETQQLES